MDEFHYKDGRLCCESMSVRQVAEAVGTPAYIYSAGTILTHYKRLDEAFEPLAPTICYSVKSCPNLHICRLLAQHGAGFDVVSGGELYRALRAGGDPKAVVFAGVGKTDRELTEAIQADIGLFNLESLEEAEHLVALAERQGARLRAALRINPDVDAGTHRYTTTGTRETKFGVDFDGARAVFERIGRNDAVRLCGLHLHIGSPVNDVGPYVRAIEKTLGLIDELRRGGFEIDTLDVGGGFGAHYRSAEAPDAATYAAAIVPLLRGRGLRIILEPGRSIVANAGILVTRVQYVKESGGRRFVIVDAGMNDLIRPALYDAYHFIWPVEPGAAFVPTERSEAFRPAGAVTSDVVGPICETGDFLGKDRPLPPVSRGDLLAVFSAGAYGMAISSQYNSRPRAAEVLVEGETFRVIRRRETYDDLVAAEVL